MSQYSGLNMPPPGPPISMAGPYGSVPHQSQSYNGYESHSYGLPLTGNKGATPLQPNLNNNIQNGPDMQPPYASGPQIYGQNVVHQQPGVPPSSVATEQISQRFKDMNMTQNANIHDYLPASGHGPPPVSSHGPPSMNRQGAMPMSGQCPPSLSGQAPPPMSGQGPPPMSGQGPPSMSGQGPPSMSGQGPPSMSGQGPPPMSGQGLPPMSGQGPLPMSGQGPPLPSQQRFGQDNFNRSPVQTESMHSSAKPQQQPPPPQQQHYNQSNYQSSISGPYRLSHPPIQQTSINYNAGNPPGPPVSSGGGVANQRFPGSGMPPTSGAYNSHSVGPSGAMNDVAQNGLYYSGSEQGPSSPYVDQANGPIVSPGTMPYPSQGMPPPPMQSRYPQQNPVPGMAPQQQQQFPPSGMNNSQNHLTAPMQAASANQNRRLDPDHMPSPIQVIEDDRKAHSTIFATNTKGQVPPLVTTDFVVSDGGICSPRFMRSTIYSVPTSSEILKQTSVPFAVVLSPFARLQEGEQPPHISDLGENGPVRCIRCKAYMCPFMQFIDGGRRFQCSFCKATTEVPPEYFAHLDHMGERVDKYQRPELCLGSYEFVATKEYCKNSILPKCPAFIFAIDVSYNSIRNGMVRILCDNLKNILSELPKEIEDQPSRIKVGFITYSNVVHFYNIKKVLAQPQVMVVPDVQEMFMPLLDGFLVDFEEAEPLISNLLNQIPDMFVETRETETVLGPAIQAGLEALKAADCTGKLFVFHSTLPIAEAPGKLKNRDDRKLLGTEKEKTILTPQSPFYNNLGQECVAAGCCVDLFLFPNAYIDVATLGQVCRLTGGQVYKYTYFQSDIDGARFLEDLRRDVSKPIAFDAILRVRTSTGIRPTEFWGNFFMSNTTDVELAAIDCDKAIAVEIKFDDKLGEEDGAFVQAAVLYTSCGGQRRLRIHNLALNTSSQMADLFRNCELDTIMNVFSKEAIRMISEQTPRQVKDQYITRSAQILACYRKHCANRSSAGQLILPECMKLLPLYINCLIKCDAIAGGQDMSTDERSFIMLALNSMNIESSACFMYPRLLPLHDIDTDTSDLPPAMRCTIEKIQDNGAYLIENGLLMFLWVGMNVNTEWIQDVFAVPTAARIDIDSTRLVEINTPLSRRIRAIINQIQSERQRYMRVVIVRQGDKLELVFRQLLVEDRTTEGSASYVDFLCHLHKEIRTLLT